MQISLPKRISTRFGESLAHLCFDILDPINLHFTNNIAPLEVDVSPCEFITPLIATPLAALQNRFLREGKYFTIRCNHEAPFSRYSKIIHFPNGLLPESIPDGNYENALSNYRTKTYIPIINFPALQDTVSNEVRENTIQALHDLLNRQLNLVSDFRTAVSYLIVELVNNIKDHSEAERGFIFAQYYPEKKYLDVCIVDDGVGILGSYHKHGILNFVTHAQAIRGAVNGTSTKNDSGGRGFGIYTSLRMLVEGMGGSFLRMSGNGHIIRNSGHDHINEVPYNMSWQGTLVGLRIPFTQSGFRYRNYLE